VFVVGCLGDWRRAAAVLFERESLSGHPAPSRKARQVAPTIPARSLGGGGLGTDFDCDGGLIAPEFARCVATREGSSQDYESTTLMAFHNRQDPDVSGDVTHPLGAQDNGMGIAFDTTQITSKANRSNPQPDDPCHPLAAKAHPPAVAFDLRGREHGAQFEGPHETANLRAASGGSSRSYVQQMQVRRLTPRECERLQGFPDDYTLIQYRNKPAADGPRYKALGNSMAVPCMHWIGKRIQRVNEIGGEQ
jgi:DNA (cytosine-5)-methyltransferase 1